MKKVAMISMVSVLAATLYAKADTVYVYGPGGPFPAMNEAAKVFSKKYSIPVQVTKGPLGKWKGDAKKNADVIYSGAEFMMTNFTHTFEEIRKETITPLYLRKSGILVRPGNPKNIKTMQDLTKPGVNVLVVTGAGLTGVWESMIGKTQDIEMLKKLRKNIVSFAKNSGAAKQEWIKDKTIDVWLTWNIWQIANKELADFVPVEEKYRVYRDCGVSLTQKGSYDYNAVKFYNFLKSKEAEPIFKKWGWQ